MLQNAINAARVKAKKALALLYEDACTIYANMPVLDKATGITEYQETALHEMCLAVFLLAVLRPWPLMKRHRKYSRLLLCF